MALSPPPRGEGALPDVMDVLQVSLKAVGVTGAFAVIGYIALVAHQHFLGIQIEVDSFTRLSFAAAAFWFDSVLTLLQQAQIHWISTLAIVLLLAALSWPHLFFTRTSKRLHLASELGVVIVLIAISSGTLILYQLPTIKLRDVMIIGLCAQPGVSSDNVLNTLTNHLWSLMVDSRGQDLKCPTKSVVGHQHKEQASADCSLKDGYAVSFLAVVAGWVLVMARPGRSSAQWVGPLRTIATFTLIMSTLMIPYTYGKVISPITMPAVEVRVRDEVQPSVNTADDRRSDFHQAGRWLDGQSLLVTENDKSIIVLNFNKQLSRVLEIPRTEITQLAITDMKDALTERIKNETGNVSIPK